MCEALLFTSLPEENKAFGIMLIRIDDKYSDILFLLVPTQSEISIKIAFNEFVNITKMSKMKILFNNFS